MDLNKEREISIKNAYEFIKNVFSNKIPQPNPSFSPDFMNTVSLITDFDDNKREHDLKSLFKLDLQSRLNVINLILKEPPEINLSDTNKEFASLISIQSCCALFFELDDKNCSYNLNTEIFDCVFKALFFFLNLSNNIDLVFQFTSIVFEKLSFLIFDGTSNNDNFLNLMDFVSISNKFLTDVLNQNQKIEKIPKCLFASLLKVTNSILNSEISDDKYASVQNYFTNSKQILIQIKPFFAYFEKLDSLVTELFQKIEYLHSILQVNSDASLNLILSILSYVVELSSISRLDFTQISFFVKTFMFKNSSKDSDLPSSFKLLNEENLSKNDESFEYKVGIMNDTFSKMTSAEKNYSISNLIDFQGKNEICSLFTKVESKLHLFYLLYNKESFLSQIVSSNLDSWSLYILLINDFLSSDEHLLDFDSKEISNFYSIEEEGEKNQELIKREEEKLKMKVQLLFCYLIPKEYFAMSLFDKESIALFQMKILSMNNYLNILKILGKSKNNSLILNNETCSALTTNLVYLFEDCSAEKIECFYENLLVATIIIQNIFLLDNGKIDKDHLFVDSITKYLQKYLTDSGSSNDFQVEVLQILSKLTLSERFIAFCSKSPIVFRIYLSLLDVSEKNSSFYLFAQKLNEELFQSVFIFASNHTDLINCEDISKCIELSSAQRQSIFFSLLCNSLKNAIFVVTNNNYYNNNNFNNSETINYDNGICQCLLKKIFKSRIPKIAVDLISKCANIQILLDFFSLSFFISSQSSQFTYMAPTIVKITSSLLGQASDTFLLINNNNNALINYIDWSKIAEQMKKVEITDFIYIEILKLLSAYTTISYPLTLQQEEKSTKEKSLASIFLFGINNPNVVCLIAVIMKTEFAKDFLDTLYNIVVNNLIQAIKLFKSGGILVLLDSISILSQNKNYEPNEKIALIETALKISVYVITFICNKETGEKFLKVFYDLKENRIQNEINFIELFKASFEPNSLLTSNFFHFNSINSLFFLPPAPLEFFENGISFVTELLIPSFGECSPSFFSYYNNDENISELIEYELFELPIYYIASENEKNGNENNYNFLVVSLFHNKITFSSNIFENAVELNIDIPKNEWFTLSISIKKWKQFRVQIIESPKPTESESKKPIVKTKDAEAVLIGNWTIPIHRIEMFNISFFSPSDVIKNYKSQRKIEGMIRRVMLFSGNFPFGISDSSKQNDQAIACRSQSLFGHFTPQFCSLADNKLKNMVLNSPESFILMINTEPIPLNNEQFVCTFCDYFLKFEGLVEFVLYFSKNGMTKDEIIMLFETLLFLFEKFPILQKGMYEINGYHLITHFLKTRQNIEIDQQLFDEICKMEEKTTNELLLDQLRSNLIFNFPNLQDCKDNELLFNIFKRWEDYDQSFLRNNISFSKYCFILFHQLAERKDIINLSISKTLMSIIVLNSKYLEKQELYLLTQLTGKISEYDINTALLLIKEMYGIAKDYPFKLDTIQRGLIEIKNKPPEILCEIVKLFDTDDEYTKRLLFTEMNEVRSIEQKKEYVLCFSNSLFNTQKRLSFDELLKLNNLKIKSINLLLFILAFGFECDDSVVSFITSCFNMIFTKSSGLVQFMSNSIGSNSITLFVFICFVIFKSHSILNLFLSLIFTKQCLFTDSLRIINILSAFCRKDLSEYQSVILNTLILKLIDYDINNQSNLISNKDDLNDIVDIIVNFICFGPNRSIFDIINVTNNPLQENDSDETEFNFSIVNFFKAYLEYPMVIEQNDFGLNFNKNGYWTDLKTVELLLTLLGSENLNEKSTKNLLILFSFVLNSHILFLPQKAAEILNRVNTIYECYFYTFDNGEIVINENKIVPIPNFDSLIPVLVSLKQSNYLETIRSQSNENNKDEYIKIIESFLDSFELTPEVYEQYNSIMNNFTSNLYDISNVGSRLLSGLTNELLNQEEKVTIDEAFSDVKQKEITLEILREKIFRKYRPVFLPPNNYRRYNIYDKHFRPFMLSNKERIKFVQIDSPIFNDKITDADEQILWSSPCQRIKVDQTFDGYFSVTNKGYRFITPKGKMCNLMKNTIKYVFWNHCNNEPLSFTFFLLNGKSLLFRFFKPETRESIVGKLSLITLDNCYFFQTKKGHEEVERLRLTQRWRERSISNFDYLMWLNLLSGRTFLDPDYYPIFPLIFTSESDKTEIRDLEKNVLFVSKDTFKKWRAARYSYDPYDNFLLNHSFSTQKVVCTFLDGIEQFRKREKEDSIQIHHYFYSSFDDIKNKMFDGVSINRKDLKSWKSCFNESQINGTNTYLIMVNQNLDDFKSFNSLVEGLKKSTVHTELIPEFFFLPEVFNIWKKEDAPNSFPEWAPNASKFILAHMSAIESEEVSMNLHNWIDIIWGVRQNDYIYNPSLSFALNDQIMNLYKSDLMVRNENLSIEGHLPPMFFAGPHPARYVVPSFESATSVFKVQMKKKAKKNSLKINFQGLVNEFFINNSKNTNQSNFNTNTESSNLNAKDDNSYINILYENLDETNDDDNIETIDIEAAVQYQESVIQMMRKDTVDPISLSVVDMRKKSVYILFSNEKVIQLPNHDTINFTKQLEISRQHSLNIIANSNQNIPGTNQNLSTTLFPNYGDPSSFCFNHSILYFIPLGSRSIYCFDFQYNRLFTTVTTASSSQMSTINPNTSHLTGITCLDSSDNYIVSGSKDTSIIEWMKDPSGISPFRILLVHQKPIKIVKIIKKMNIMLSVDAGGQMCISMFPFLKMIKMVDLGFAPSMIDMTKGCIIAFDGSKVVSFTSNGEKICERRFKNFTIVSEVAVEVVSRSDVVLIAASNKEILLLNCVSLEIVGVLSKLESVAKLLQFDENSGTAVIVTELNEVLFTQIPD